MAKIYRKFRGLANSSRNFQSFQRYHSLALQFLGIVYPSIPSAPFAQASLKVTIQIGKVGESIWQYSQFVSRRAQCYQVYIYIYIRYKSNGGLGSLPAAYRFLFQLSFLPTFPIVRRKYRIENWFLTRPTLLPPTPPIYKENGGLTFHS